MIDVSLTATPNQTLTIQILERVYDISVKEANGVMCASITIDGEVVVSGMRVTAGTPLLPYRYQESGNFMLTTEADSLPYYDQFGVTQFLVYLTADELAAYRAS